MRDTNLSRPTSESKALEELRLLRAELKTFRQLFDEFARAFLNAKFPFGRPVDRWGRRRG